MPALAGFFAILLSFAALAHDVSPPASAVAARMRASAEDVLTALPKAARDVIARPFDDPDRVNESVRFGWAGATEPGRQHYYRVQGSLFLIEYDASQDGGNHIHTVWRDFNGDFGRDLLRQHYDATKGTTHRHSGQ